MPSILVFAQMCFHYTRVKFKKKSIKRNKQLMLMKIDSIFPFVYYINFVVDNIDILLQLTFST